MQLKSEIYYVVLTITNDATQQFCWSEERRFTNLTDVHSADPKQEYEIIEDADGNKIHNITSFISPIRIFYSIGNVARAKEYPVQPLFENEEFIAAVEKYYENRKNDNNTWDEYDRLKDEVFRIIFGEKLEFTVEEKRIINEELTMAI